MTQAVTCTVGLCLLLLTGSAAAETVYVTDKLYLGLYESADTAGRPLTTLVSGTALEVLERAQRAAKVRTPDGKVGWTKTAYLVTEKPPRLVLTETEARSAALSKQLSDAQAGLADAKAKAAELQTQAAAAIATAERDRTEAEKLRGENRDYRERAAAYGTSVPLSWFLGTIAVVLLLGFTAGLAWLDHRMRKRHGGFRIY